MYTNALHRRTQIVYDKLITKKEVKGMILGAYTGYFQERTSNKNIVYPYSQYKKHYILGMIYSREEFNELKVEKIENYKYVASPIYNIKMFFYRKI